MYIPLHTQIYIKIHILNTSKHIIREIFKLFLTQPHLSHALNRPAIQIYYLCNITETFRYFRIYLAISLLLQAKAILAKVLTSIDKLTAYLQVPANTHAAA